LDSISLGDEKMPPQPIPYSAIDGIAQVSMIPGPPHDVAVTEIKLYKTVVGAGCNTRINVTVENHGQSSETFNVTLTSSRPDIRGLNISLFASTANGWGFTMDNMTRPGPTIIVRNGDIINLTLTSVDMIIHNFFVDYNGDMVPSPGEPKSPDFPQWGMGLPTISYQFRASTVGNFTYYCMYHGGSQHGEFQVVPPPVIETPSGREEISLESGAGTTLTWVWGTTEYGMYNFIGAAEPVPGETDTADNTLVSGTLNVTIPGDFNGDFRVGPADFALLARAFGSTPQKPLWNCNCDANDDDKVGPADFAILSKYYGAHWP
jgi:hypothetical protein